MTEMTYTRCPACRGSLHIVTGPDIPLAATQHVACPCARADTPGWAPTGVTLGQIERMAELERALAGDPGVPEARRRKALARARAALSREDATHG